MTTTPPDPGSKKAIASPRQSEPPQTTAQPDESRRKKKKTESPAGNRSDRIEKLEREREGGGDKWEPHARHLAAWLRAAAPWRRGCRWANGLLLLVHLAAPLPLALRMAKRRKRTNLSPGFSNPAAPRRRLYGFDESMGIGKGDLAGEPSEKDSIYLPGRGVARAAAVVGSRLVFWV